MSLSEQIQAAFSETPYPGDAFLVGSHEGCEPEEEVGPFRGKTDWTELDAAFLDEHAWAFPFFSEGALRFFMPAYLIADADGRLESADPLFTLTHGFSDSEVSIPAGGKNFIIQTGGSAFINPLRYGAMTFQDYARHRLSVFSREEAEAIVVWLEFKRGQDTHGISTPQIDAALDQFWRARAESAPTSAELRQSLEDQAAYQEHLRSAQDDL